MNDLPNWNEMSNCSNYNKALFSIERVQSLISVFWNHIVMDEEVDNNEVVSMWIQTCEFNPALKEDYIDWLACQREANESEGPMSHGEVFQYLKHTLHSKEFRLAGMEAQIA